MKAVTKIFKRKKKDKPQAGDSATHEKPAATVPVAPQTRSIPTMKNQVSKPSKSNFSEFTVKSHTNEAAENALGKESQLSKVEEAVAKASSNGKAASGTKQAPETAKSAEPPPPQAVENNMRDARSSPEMPKEGREKDNYKGVSDSFKGMSTTQRFGVSDLEDTDSNLFMNHGDAYDAIPLIEQIKLPRGGISIETKAVGRVQFGIPPETIKDSMRLGLPVPQVYIVPAERFCREMGPALGVNLAEFEFPAYFNFFVYKKRCTLVVDSQEAQDNICRVFSETLLGPAQFRREKDPIAFEEEDFDPSFNRDAIPNFQKELEYFRIMPDGNELVLETLLNFTQFHLPGEGGCHDHLGVPPHIFEADDLGDDPDDDFDDEDLEEALDTMIGGEECGEEEELPKDAQGVENREHAKWAYKSARWVGDVATVWPVNATEDEKRDRTIPRVEIFKMPSGTEYILHDIDMNNNIIGKARFSGHLKVSESMSVDGFGGRSFLDDAEEVIDDDAGDDHADRLEKKAPLIPRAPPTFHAPSFGVTVLGNSHGFDKSGSVSGYVLWINGRGVMIDPPPYSSATLEREGIRPRTIVGIILTHCHADHDAGAFQKVLTGSPVVVITTPTIYKSFIRKYAALASLSPALLRHSHRHKPAIIGQPLRFQGATFHFTYSLHTIPCVGFKVEWRGRSMVFTGDHFNYPPAIDKLQADGVLSKARADDLRNLPLQETDLLLHESGAPPIHTPLEVLLKLPPRVKKRMYVVHTSSLPEDCELRVAPTGTAGTIRLDQFQRSSNSPIEVSTSPWMQTSMRKPRNSRDAYSISLEEDEILPSPWMSASNEYGVINEDSFDGFYEDNVRQDRNNMSSSFAHLAVRSKSKNPQRTSLVGAGGSSVPLVSLRPASSTDAWFILNLLSAVPFLSSLSYSSTMEVLETARVDAYCKNDVVVPVSRRGQLLCVVWEGTCVERDRSQQAKAVQEQDSLEPIPESEKSAHHSGAVWQAGDWTGPIALQPEKWLSGESELSATHDIVAISSEGVKVITVEFAALHNILKSGSVLYRKYLERRDQQKRRLSFEVGSQSSTNSKPVNSKPVHTLLTEALRNLNVLELLDQNSGLRKLSAVQKRHLESLAEGPVGFGPGDRLWRCGAPVDKAFLMISGTASFVPRRRNAGSNSIPSANMGITASTKNMLSKLDESSNSIGSEENNVGEEMKMNVMKAIEELGETDDQPVKGLAPPGKETNEVGQLQLDSLFSRSGNVDGPPRARSVTEAHDFAKLSRNLQKRADLLSNSQPENSDASVASSADASGSEDSDHFQMDYGDDLSAGSGNKRASLLRRRSSAKARFANKVLGRLYSRRAFTGGLIFSRGHFLGDVSKMVAGLLSSEFAEPDAHSDDPFPVYGFGDKSEGDHDFLNENLTDMVIHEQEEDSQIVHSSTLTAGKEGCVVLVFPKASLIPFLDEYPGLLLSLLGTQVVV